MARDRITREDAASALGARLEVGRELEPEIADAFADRVERAIDARVEERVAAERRSKDDDGIEGTRLALAIVSLGTGVPITAIAAEQGGVVGIIAAWAGIVGVNFASGFKRR
jgi:hypothetical protein